MRTCSPPRAATTRSPGTRTWASTAAALRTPAGHHHQRGVRCLRSVYATDLDGDGDADVLSASQTPTTRSPGTRTPAAAPSAPAGHHHQRGLWLRASTPPIWTGTGMRTCCPRRPSSTTRSPGTRTLEPETASTAAPSDPNSSGHHHQRDWCRASVYATDLDGDGDADVLSASYLRRQDRLVRKQWAAAPSDRTAGHHHQRGWCLRSVYATDLDGDGDADVLSASNGTLTTRSPGTKTGAAAPSAPSRSSPPARSGAQNRLRHRSWTATGMRTCCPGPTERRQDRLAMKTWMPP